ncbi:MAG: FAD-binding oxidoreductase [Candidatus Heimdallarchaeota archaeon]|nr:MAG: FAD-binding oxidoreductase [Candidatus Heimdallarchaeota archaeon]
MSKIKTITLSHEEAFLSGDAIENLKGLIQGDVLLPSDDEYNNARKIWNGMIDKCPALIVRCTGPADVIDAVKFAREHNLLVAVRGGGHNVTGNALCDDGMVIDLSRMKGIHVDPKSCTARAQAGVTLGELDHETQVFGLAVPSGIVTTTGIAGLTLGGGFGYLSRKYGLTIDNLISVDLVTAEGEFLKASKTENEDLFWGLCGGGGNFGIVTSFEYKLQKIGPQVLGGMLLHPMEVAPEFLRFYRDFIADTPDELTVVPLLRLAPPAPFLPKVVHGKPVVGILVLYTGSSIEEGESLIAPLRQYGTPLIDGIGPKPFRALQSFLDVSARPGLNYYVKSEFLPALNDDIIDTLVEHASRITSPLSVIAGFHLGGAVSRIDEDSTAYSHRNASYSLILNTAWIDPNESDKHIKWTRAFWDALQPFSVGGAYVNFQSYDEGEDRVKTTYGTAKLERLSKLKRKFDPQNFFRLNRNIKP